jgi:hypothetical protein
MSNVIVQQKVEFVTDLRQTCTTILIAIDHLADLRARETAHGGQGWIADADMSMTQHDGLTGGAINAAASTGPTLKDVLDASGGAVRALLEGVR